VLAILLTAAGALTPDLVWLGTTQTLARAFSTTMAILVSIIAVEEMPKGSRAFAVSVLTMTAALGAGLCVMLLRVAQIDEGAWRILFLVPLLGLIRIRKLGRALPESRRFTAREVRAETAATSAIKSHIDRGRLLLLAATALFLSLFVTPASFFLNEYLRTERDFSALNITFFQILTNTPGGLGIVVGGMLADARGRRVIGAIGLGAGVGFTVLMYLGSGWEIWIWSLLGALIGAMAVPALGVYGPELFPTGSRGKANGVITLFGVVGSAVGLVLAGQLADNLSGGLPHAMALLAIGPAIVVVLVLVLYPETAARELEDLNPEDAPITRELLALEGLDLDTIPERYPPRPGGDVDDE
jgi:MFS family permease